MKLFKRKKKLINEIIWKVTYNILYLNKLLFVSKLKILMHLINKVMDLKY